MPRTKEFDREDVIQKARELFWQKGYEATSMDELVNNLGISRSSLYDTFGDKHQLYCATLNSYCELNAYTLAKEATQVENPLAFIQYVFDIIIDQAKKDKDNKGCYVVNSMVEFSNRDEKIKAIVDANNKTFETMLQGLIQRGQKTGTINQQQSAKQLAQFLLNTIYGMRISARSNASIKELKDVVKVAMGVLR
jgi:TetR/AcrR family transcriptional regulator, transcriptional repressor for nem operon